MRPSELNELADEVGELNQIQSHRSYGSRSNSIGSRSNSIESAIPHSINMVNRVNLTVYVSIDIPFCQWNPPIFGS